MALQALLDSAISFCNHSSAVSMDLDPITVIKNIDTYEIETPDQTSVATTLKLWYDGKIIAPATYEEATAQFTSNKGAPRFYFGSFVDEVYCITLMPIPQETLANSLRVRVALTPTRSATQVHTLLYDRYAHAIVSGALAIICAIPDQPFTDIPRAQAEALKARAAANNARIEIMHGNAQSSLSVKMRAF